MSLPEFDTLQPDKNIPDFPKNAENFIYEPKYDGIRTLIYFEEDSISFVSRRRKPVSNLYSKFKNSIQNLLSAAGIRSAVLDGEVIAVTPEYMSGDWDALSNRNNRACVLQYRCFDILYYNGRDCRGFTTLERKKILAKVCNFNTLEFRLVPYGSGIEDLAPRIANYQHLEGYVAKNTNAKYESGRQRTWVKLKERETEVVMCTGWVPGLGKFAGGVGCLKISWILQDTKLKTFVLKPAGEVGSFAGAEEESRLVVSKYVQNMDPFKQFPVEISYLRKTADGHVYHGVFHKIVNLEEF